MKNKTTIQKHASEQERPKTPRSAKEQIAGQGKLDTDRSLHDRAQKRTNYHNDGPGGGYDGL